MTQKPGKFKMYGLLALCVALAATITKQAPLRAATQDLTVHVYIDINANLAQDTDEPNVPDFTIGVEYLGPGVISAEAYVTDAGGNIDVVMPNGDYILSLEANGQIVHLDFTLPFDIEIGLQPSARIWLPVVEVAR